MKKAAIVYLNQVLICLSFSLQAQNVPIFVELENGMVGTDFVTVEEGGVTFLTVTSNRGGNNPGSADRIVTVEVTFPAAQTYDLYVRCRVGTKGRRDDSFFYGNGFGTKSPSRNRDWISVNKLEKRGYSIPMDVVNGAGNTGKSVWKWINLSEFAGGEQPARFKIEESNLRQTFQIGAREDGFDMDKIAFARSDYFFTVANLDSGKQGEVDENGNQSNFPIAYGYPKFLGCTYSAAQTKDFANYWNQVTPENAGKWGRVEASRDVMVWNELDHAHRLAKENGFYFKLHVLVWGNQQPAWIESLPPDEQLAEIIEWFKAIAYRYPDIDAIEVVNEPLHDPPGSPGGGGGNYLRALGGKGTTGWDWVLEAFRLARQYFPNARLMLNDYEIINNNNNVARYLEIIHLLQKENLIDQIGVQAHAFSNRADEKIIKANLDRLAETKLPIFITELDIDGPTDEKQLTEYQRIFPVFWNHPAVEGITLWGFRPGLWRTDEKAYLIDTDGVTERPALKWLRGFVSGSVGTGNVIIHPNTLFTADPVKNGEPIKVFPNPIRPSEVLTIKGEFIPERVLLYRMDGTIAYETTLKENRFRIPGTLTSGLYFVILYDKLHSYVKKIMVQ